MLKRYVLLITSCIKPNKDVPFLKLCNWEERERQYKESLEFYIKKTRIKNIVFCDSSLVNPPENLYQLANKYSKNVEWISFSGDTKKTAEKGKGYGEGEIMEYALRESKLLAQADYVVKVTGRVFIKNIDMLIRFMNNKKIYFYRNSSTNVDTKLFGMPLKKYKVLFMNLYKDVDDINNKYLENVFSDAIIDNDIIISRFIVFPNAQGISGSTGKPYNISFMNRIKRTIKLYYHS